MALLIARKIASTGPSPVNEPSTTVSSGVRTATVACGGPAVGGLDLEPLQRVALDVGAQLVGDQRLEVHRRDLLLAVGDLLEALEGLLELGAVDRVAEVLQRLAQRRAAGVLAQHERVGVQADGLRASMIS